MSIKVVMQRELPMGAAERIREMAEVVIDPDLDRGHHGADIVVVVGGRVDAEFMTRAGRRLKMIATPGIGVDKIDVDAASRARHHRHPQPRSAYPIDGGAYGRAADVHGGTGSMAGDRFLRRRSDDRPRGHAGNRTQGAQSGGCRLWPDRSPRGGRSAPSALKMNVIAYDPYIDLQQGTPEGVTLTDRSRRGVERSPRFVTDARPLDCLPPAISSRSASCA